ncbi:histidine utilization repressor [Endozoicomonas sp. GU-1]|uniref:histidine utilization repressor n=1 Tax=Endozoicomonas sp. GU-1 TaxID=3009078 RepID=UPI0022B3DB2A|nr:histidine utilization repressor [Endozoicomonas sp. GU-1]WBA80741.1 histidine utilization repressor [Endozoicomonas sp. GU-1]WBA88307.1 histidine utilization repressor [Endozoicomonas sp. GU-1]
MNQSLLPRYQQIKHYILDKIECGEWTESRKVPSENELCQQFSVSRMTARKALQELTASGVLMRQQGLGTFVAPIEPQSSILTVKNIADEIRGRGHGYSNRVLLLSEEKATEAIAVSLELPESATVFHSIIIHYENGLPLQWEERHINPRFAPDYLKQDFSRETPNVYLTGVAALTEATHVVEAVLPSKEVAEALAMEAGAPCLRITRRSWCRHGVVSLARLMHPGDRYRLGDHLQFS